MEVTVDQRFEVFDLWDYSMSNSIGSEFTESLNQACIIVILLVVSSQIHNIGNESYSFLNNKECIIYYILGLSNTQHPVIPV